jgi:hypothetical protein
MTPEPTMLDATLEADAAPGADAASRAALDRAVRHLRSLQHEDGWWQGELETNVTMDAEDLLMREFLGVRTDAQTEESARWIRSQQRDDGSWANFHGGPPELSTTVEAYLALRLAGDAPELPRMAAARRSVLSGGGVEASRVFTRIWLALFGLWDWSRLPAVPVEHILLPRCVPLNVYDFACWADRGAHLRARLAPPAARPRSPARRAVRRCVPGEPACRLPVRLGRRLRPARPVPAPARAAALDTLACSRAASRRGVGGRAAGG